LADEGDHADTVRRLIAHRCPELTDDDINAVIEPYDTLPREISEQILTVLDGMMDRLNELTEAVRVNGSDNDAAEDDPFGALSKQTRDIQNVVDQCRRAMVDLEINGGKGKPAPTGLAQ